MIPFDDHAQHDFRDPRRDHEHGRIWRITHQDRPLVEKPKLEGIPVPELVEHLKSPEDWTRHQARKELSARDPDEVLQAVEAWVENLSADLPDYDHHLVEAMWACQNVERASEQVLKKVLSAKDGHARSAGARVIRYWHEELSDPVGMIAKLAGDPFPRTRMEAVLSAGFIPQAEAYTATLSTLDHPSDPNIDQAMEQTRKALLRYWRPALEAGTLAFGKKSHQEFVEQEAGIGFAERLTEFLKAEAPSDKEIAGIQTQLRAVGTAKEIGLILDALGNDQRPSEITIALLETLEPMADARQAKSLRRKLGNLNKLLKSKNDTVAGWAARNMGAWNARGADAQLLAVLKDPQRGKEARRAAAIALAKLEKTAILETLDSLSREGDIEMRYFALTGLANADLNRGIESAVLLLSEDPGAADPVPAVQAILQHRKGGGLLVQSLQGTTLHSTVKTRVSEFHRTSGQLPQKLADLFTPSLESGASLSARLLAENQEALTADVEKLGDPFRGEMIFRRKALACVSCHAIGSAGSEIGPNLVAVGTAATTSYMVESILKPNAAIAEHFENRLFTLKDGSVRMGVVTFKSDQEVVVRDSAQGGKEVRMPAADIQREQALPSLMPAGLADQLQSRSEFLDLSKFLSVLGKPGDFANDESPVLRKWRVMADPGGDTIPREEAAWMPAYSKISGELPAEDLNLADRVLARSFLEVQAAGTIKLALDETDGLTLWMDGKLVEDMTKPLEVETGRHVLTFSIDRQKRGDKGLRVGIEGEDKVVRFQPEGGM